MQALVALFIVPLTLLNAFGGIASGIWLAVLGEWWAIGYGLLGLFAPFLLAFVLVPGLIFAAPAGLLLFKGRYLLAIPLLFLNQFYTSAVVTLWCLLVFYFFITKANTDTFWPLLIWSYGVALGPWMYMAQKEDQGQTDGSSSITTFFAQIAYIAIALVVAFRGATLVEAGLIFGGVMIIGMLIQWGIAIILLREDRRIG